MLLFVKRSGIKYTAKHNEGVLILSSSYTLTLTPSPSSHYYIFSLFLSLFIIFSVHYYIILHYIILLLNYYYIIIYYSSSQQSSSVPTTTHTQLVGGLHCHGPRRASHSPLHGFSIVRGIYLYYETRRNNSAVRWDAWCTS